MTMQPLVWEPIDYESAWGPFDASFNFRPGVDPSAWPSITEPSGSIVYDVAHCFDGRGTGEWLRHGLNFTLVWALADVVGPASPVVVLDWQHPTYHFWPHRNTATEPTEMLSMNHTTPVADGDYYAFLSPDFETGTFGNPWEQTICVFGSALRARVEPILNAMVPVARVVE